MSKVTTPLDDRALRWREDLEAWGIPAPILAQAPTSPWIHPVAMFTVSGDVPDSESHRRAREALPTGGSVLDVGCGGGRASMALVPPASAVIGVDQSAQMLTAYRDAAAERDVDVRTVQGQWPQVAADVERADVVVCHHVAYNVSDILPFLRALDDHAVRRVVLELPTRHPLSWMNPLWERFWGLRRPDRPSASDLHEIAVALGFDAHLEQWDHPSWRTQLAEDSAEAVVNARIRLCLSADRDAQIATALRDLHEPETREVATLWWDVAQR